MSLADCIPDTIGSPLRDFVVAELQGNDIRLETLGSLLGCIESFSAKNSPDAITSFNMTIFRNVDLTEMRCKDLPAQLLFCPLRLALTQAEGDAETIRFETSKSLPKPVRRLPIVAALNPLTAKVQSFPLFFPAHTD